MKKSDEKKAKELSKIFSDFANKMSENSKDKTQNYIKFYTRAAVYFYHKPYFKTIQK
jgi:hypothetical protein